MSGIKNQVWSPARLDDKFRSFAQKICVSIFTVSIFFAQASYGGGITVITHGFQPTGGWPIPWVDSMTDRILVEAINRGENVSRWEYDPSIQRFVMTGYYPIDNRLASLERMILKYNWAIDSNDAGGGFAEAAGEALFAALMRGAQLPDGTPVSFVEMPLHFIGHSRGAVVNSEAVERLGALGINVDHATTLDPYPAGGVYQDALAGANSWENITFADNYWEDNGNNGIPDGISVGGTAERQLDNVFLETGGYANIFDGGSHADVHLWYHGTIDLSTIATDGDKQVPVTWYAGLMGPRDGIGFAYSRIFGGDRIANGGSAGLKGSGGRFEIFAQKWIANGDFSYNPDAQSDVSGYTYHGGQQSFILNTLVDPNGCLRWDAMVMRHNQIYVPRMSGIALLQFRLKIMRSIVDDANLKVSMIVSGVATQQLINLPIGAETDWTDQQVDLSSFKGQAGLIEFRLENAVSLGVEAHLDDIRITGTPLPWANLQLKPLPKTFFTNGEQITVQWDLEQDLTTPGATVDWIWDTDRNPYNGSNAVAAAGLNSSVGQAIFPVSGLPVGSYHLYARITDVTGSFRRYDFIQSGVTIGNPAPVETVATSISATQIQLSWSDSSLNRTGFRIERSTSALGPWRQIAQVASNVMTFRNSGLFPATTYYYRIREFGAWGSSEYSTLAVATTPLLGQTKVMFWTYSKGRGYVQALTNVIAVAANSGYNLGLKSDGSVVGWQSGSFTGTVLPGISNIVAVAVGGGEPYRHALTRDGVIVAWLSNDAQATSVPLISNVVAIAAGAENDPFSYNLALKGDGTVVAWRLWGGFSSYSLGISNVIAISRTLALESDGTVVDLGGVTAPGLSNVVALATGGSYAITSDGAVIYWGGDGTQPAVVSGLSNVTVVATTTSSQPYGTTIALKNDGTLVQLPVSPGGLAFGPPSDPLNGIAIAAGWLSHLAVEVVLPAPSGVTATAISSDRIDISWTDNSDNENGFKVERSTDASNFSPIATVSEGTTSYSDTGLLSCANYYYRVRAYNWSGNSGMSNIESEQTLCVGSLKVIISPEGATNSGAQWRVNAGAWRSSGDTVNDLIVGNYIVDFNTITNWDSPAHQNVTVNNNQTTTANGTYIQWTGSLLVAISPQCALDGGAQWQVDGGAWQPSGATVSDLIVGQHTIHFSLLGTGSAPDDQIVTVTHNQISTNVGLYIQTLIPNIPSDLTATSLSPSQIDLTWEDNSFIESGCRIERATNVAGPWTQIAVVAPSIATYRNTRLLSGTEYFYRVCAYNCAGNSDYSNPASATTEIIPSDCGVVAWGKNGDAQTEVPAGLSNIIAIASGDSHSLALKADGTVVAWGSTPGGPAVAPSDLTNVIRVAAGAHFNLALKRDGSVLEWNVAGESDWYYWDVTNVVAVACGRGHGLALTKEGLVIALGDNDYGQTEVPVLLAEAGVVAIAAGGCHSLALSSNGTVMAWGKFVPDSGSELLATPPADLSNVVAIASGKNHCLALKVDGTVVAWGFYCRDGEEQDAYVPNDIEDIVAIAAGSNHDLALRSDGTVSAWGTNWFGTTDVPLQLTNVVAIGAGSQHSLALIDCESDHGDGEPFISVQPVNRIVVGGSTTTLRAVVGGSRPMAYQWKTNGFENQGETNSSLRLINTQLTRIYTLFASNSFGSITSSPISVAVLPLIISTQPRAQTVFAGDTVTLNVSVNGMGPFSYEWFFNGSHLLFQTNFILQITSIDATQFGEYAVVVSNSFGSVTSSVAFVGPPQVVAWGEMYNLETDEMVPAFVPPGLNRVVALAAGQNHYLALKTDGNLIGWGSYFNQDANVDLPAVIPSGLRDVVAIAAGLGHSLALTSDGKVFAWGDNTYGQTEVPNDLSNVVMLAAGEEHSLALKRDGTIIGWGTSDTASVPQGLSNVVMVVSGGHFAIALQQDGIVTGWGATWSSGKEVPVGLSNVIAIATGWDHGLALLCDGTVVQWGLETEVPANISNIVAIASGPSWHSLGLKSDRTVVAWGDNGSGQLDVPVGLSDIISLATSKSSSLALLNSTYIPSPWLQASFDGSRFVIRAYGVRGISCVLLRANQLTGTWLPIQPVVLTNSIQELRSQEPQLPSQFYRFLRR